MAFKAVRGAFNSSRAGDSFSFQCVAKHTSFQGFAQPHCTLFDNDYFLLMEPNCAASFIT